MSSFENARFYEVFVSVGFSCFRRLWLLGNVIQKTKGRSGQTKKTGFLLVSQLRFKVRLCLTEQTTVRFRIYESTTEITSQRICRRCAWPSRHMDLPLHFKQFLQKSRHSVTCKLATLIWSSSHSFTHQQIRVRLVSLTRSYTSVAHGLHTSQLFLCQTEIWFVHKCRQFHCVNFSKECR